VFVDKETEKVNRVVGSAHTGGFINNLLENPELDVDEHIGIMIEGNSHASCTDKNNDSIFLRDSDVSNGYSVYPLPAAYGLGVAYSAGRNIPFLIAFPKPWNFRIEWMKVWQPGYLILHDQYSLKKIDNDFIDKFNGLEKFDDPTTPIYILNPIFGGFALVAPLQIDGYPPDHPWTQPRYDNPEKIIPKLNNYTKGKISPSNGNSSGAIVAIASEEIYFTFSNENGEFLINNIEPGEHNIIVNLENYAPYKQRFIIEENETTVGVNGILNLIPESESFRFEGTAKDEKGNLIINVPVDVYDENNQKLFTTLTDENGQYLFNLSSKENHFIKIIQEDKIGEIENVSANPGETILEEIIVSNPKSLKENTLSDLEEIETENKIVKNQINKIKKLIEESLDESLWIDDWHLKEKKLLGLKVFQKEFNAVKRIEKILKYSKSKCRKNKCKDLKSILPILNKSVNDLNQADYLLSETILNETKKELENLDKDKLNKKQKKLLKIIDKRIKKAENYLKKAKKQRLKKNYSKSIYYSMRTWNLSKQNKYLINLIKKGK
jgi:hypothetical protein